MFSLQNSVSQNPETIQLYIQRNSRPLHKAHVGCVSPYIYLTYTFSDTFKIKISVKCNFWGYRHEDFLKLYTIWPAVFTL